MKFPRLPKIRIPGLSRIQLPKLYKFQLPEIPVVLGIVTLTGIFITQRILMDSRLPENPIQLVLDCDINMYSSKGIDSTIVKLHKGDTVSYLGVDDGGVNRPVSFFVQTRDGLRGMLSTYDLGYTMLRKNKPDTMQVTVLGMKKEKKADYYRYSIRCSDGTETTALLDQIRPILPDSLRKLQLRNKSYYYMTREKFERLYIGQTLGANDSLYRPAVNIYKTKTGWEAYFKHLCLVDTKKGETLWPIVVYNSDKVAIGYRPFGTNSNNRYIVKYMPLLDKIVDIDLLAKLIEGPFYQNRLYGLDNYTPKQHSTLKQVSLWQWLQVGVYIAFGLIWIFLFHTLIMLLLEAGLYIRHLYYPLSDGVLTLLFGLVAFTSTYIWFALATVWGALWIVSPIILYAGASSYNRSVQYLNTEPHTRCLNCRRMFTNRYLKREFVREYEEWGNDSVAVGSHTEKWQSWTEVTTKWSDGRTTTGKENVQNHTRTTTTYNDYKVLYKVREYEISFRCNECGYIEKLIDNEYEELKREYVGQSTSTYDT